jgi:hypothetical protein
VSSDDIFSHRSFGRRGGGTGSGLVVRRCVEVVRRELDEAVVDDGMRKANTRSITC